MESHRRGHIDVIFGQPHLAVAGNDARTEGDYEAPAAESRFDVRPMSPFETDEELYVRLAPELIRFATSLVGPADAEDLLATAVTKAIASLRWSGVENRRAYLYRMLVNEAHKSRRSTWRREQCEQRVVDRDAVDSERGVDPDLLRLLKRLTVRQRAVVYLTYWADLAPHRIADTLDISLRTVERELTNARTRLEQMLS